MNNYFFSLVISFCMSGIFLMDAMEHNLLYKSIVLPLKTQKVGTYSWSKVATICDIIDTIIDVPSTTFSWKKYDSLCACALLKNKTSTQKSESSIIRKNVQVKKEENEQGPFFSDLPEELFLPCVMTNDLFTTIKNLLIFGQVSHHYREKVLSQYCTDIVTKKFKGNPVSIALALGNFSRPEVEFQKKWIAHMASREDKEKVDIIRFYTGQNDLSGLIVLLKYKFKLFDYFFLKTKYGAGNAYNKSLDILFQDESKKEILGMLLNFYKFDLNGLTSSPILCMVINDKCSLSFIQYFMEKGAQVRGENSYKLIQKAAVYGRKDIMEFLVSHGAQFSPDQGASMIEALSRRYEEIVIRHKKQHKKKQYNKALKFILQFDVNLNWGVKHWKKSLLHYCILFEHRKGVKLLLDCGIDRTIRIDDGMTALEYAKEELSRSSSSDKVQRLNGIINLLENYEPKNYLISIKTV